jgi:hypothetical protein
MPRYLWSGKDASGRELVEWVEAESPQQARDSLLARGWTDTQLRTSEVHDFVKQQMQAVSDPAYRPHLTPRQELAMLQGKGRRFWPSWYNSIRESAGTHLCLALLLVWSISRHRFWGTVICGASLLVLAFVFPVVHFWFSRTSQLFEKLHQARNWRKWDEVLRYLDALQRAQKSRKIGIGDAETTRYRALALTGLGKFEEGLALFSQAAQRTNMPTWLFHCHVASLCIVAEKYEEALKSYQQAFEASPEKSTVCIDYGSCLVQRFNRPAEARKLLAIAESCPVTDMAKDHLVALRGLIALREGNFGEAHQHFSTALDGFEKRGQTRFYIFEPSILLAHGYLALVNAALGNRDAAQFHFQKSHQYLAVIRMDELIADYQSRMNSLTAGAHA